MPARVQRDYSLGKAGGVFLQNVSEQAGGWALNQPGQGRREMTTSLLLTSGGLEHHNPDVGQNTPPSPRIKVSHQEPPTIGLPLSPLRGSREPGGIKPSVYITESQLQAPPFSRWHCDCSCPTVSDAALATPKAVSQHALSMGQSNHH